MFGYVRIDRSQLSDTDYEAYRSVYCSLCKQLGRDYSLFARFILSYDCTFYALLMLSMEQDAPCSRSGRCTFNPLKKCTYVLGESKALSRAAALSVSTAYYKLVDNINDSPWYKRIAYRLIKPIFGRWNRKAKKLYPEIEQAVSDMMDAQLKAESKPDCSIDYAAEPTAMMLSKVCEDSAKDIPRLNNKKSKRILSTFGYFLGRWIYLMDAVDDYDKDLKHGGFNPYILNHIDRDDLFDQILPALNHSLSEVLLSYGLMDICRYQTIIENILYSACPKQQRSVLSKYNPGDQNEKSV